MPTAALAAFVLGVWALQWQTRLPANGALLAVLLVGGALAVSAVRASRRPYAIAAAIAAAVAFGFA